MSARWLPFKKARERVHRQGLKSLKEWGEWSKSGERPTNIPSLPSKTYRESVACQRDDADPQTFSRRYGEYRGGFARELAKSGAAFCGGGPFAGRCLGAIDNFLGTRNETVVVSNHLYPPIERYDPSTSGAPQAFLDTWEKMDISMLYGFPLWGEDVFTALSGAFNELISIFAQYAKADAKSNGDASRMQQTELTDLALDCSLATDAVEGVTNATVAAVGACAGKCRRVAHNGCPGSTACLKDLGPCL